MSKTKLQRLWCAWFGHTRVVDSCLGYITCGRCDAQLGDTLAGVYSLKENVLLHHNCSKCRTNWAGLSWHEKVLIPDPFTKRTGV